MDELVSQLEREVKEALRRGDLSSAVEAFAAFFELIGESEIPEAVRLRLAALHRELVAAETANLQMRLARHEQRKHSLNREEKEDA